MRNLERLSGRLDALGGRLHAGARRGVERAAGAACAEARELAPVDTGRLRESIRYAAAGESASVTTDCPYAAAVEFGTSKAAAQPFMAPAAAGQRAEFLREMKNAVRG